MLFLWAIVLQVNPDLFKNAPSFGPLAQMVQQSTWAMLCLVVGGGRLVMLAINGAWRRSPHLRALAAFISCFFWFQISLGFLQAGTFGTGLAIYPVLFALDVYNAFRAAGDAGSSDRIHSRSPRNGTDT
ncbi:MAG: hypothetical protein JNK47_12665 [Mesorhizobium sp.]|nr:hypothetical protein [Mesorhizobium sp.]MBL8578073.1 hypothetical protein [Mesorhizobium sp.]